MKNRWWIYQQERFPLAAHTPLVFIFCLSVMLFSALQQDDVASIAWLRVAGAFVSTLIAFFQLRVADEFKDHDIDARFRSHRAVPRGLVSLRELATLAYAGAAVQFVIALYFDVGLVPILAVVWLYMALMTREFFAPAWLRRHPLVYLFSHMLVMPLIAFYVSAFDWLCQCNERPAGLGWLLLLSFTCGLVLEIGRKIRSPVNERPGVETYSALWGPTRAALVWIASIVAAAIAYANALPYLSASINYTYIAVSLPAIALLTALPLLMRGRQEGRSSARAIEPASGVIALILYLFLGPAQAILG
jgi:4-hydroxybenzoate polyprenyltransferase